MMKAKPGRSIRQRDYLPSLDGWRAVAILWVMQAHGPAWSLGWISNRWVNANGDRGVQLFFALSGLLICMRLLREEQRFGAISLRSFYTRRLFRIQPAALVYLGVIALLMVVGMVPVGWKGIVGAVAMIRNFFPAQGGTWETQHFWSLAGEEHFYLFLPGFLVLTRRYRLAVMSVLVIGFEFWRILLLGHPRLQGVGMVNYLRTDMVIGGILLGCVFALALDRPGVMGAAKRYLPAWLGLLYAAVIFATTTMHQSRANHAMIISVYPVLITATMLHSEWAPVRFVGRISYSLYLWQMLFLNPYLAHEPHTFHLRTAVAYCGTFACAIASYYLVETPLIRRGHRIAKRFDLQVARELAVATHS
jgi:peptidoglycan/LPS O-acetylase OafA/YrhL